jgi:hypothetical protein
MGGYCLTEEEGEELVCSCIAFVCLFVLFLLLFHGRGAGRRSVAGLDRSCGFRGFRALLCLPSLDDLQLPPGVSYMAIHSQQFRLRSLERIPRDFGAVFFQFQIYHRRCSGTYVCCFGALWNNQTIN